MNCTVASANNFLGQSGIISRISLAQLAGSVRKFNLNRPFICPILEAKQKAGPIQMNFHFFRPFSFYER